MKRSFPHWCAAALLLTGMPAARATDPADARAIRFVTLFHDACMVYFGQDQALNATLARNGFRLLSMRDASAFLQGSSGLVWQAPRSLGALVVALGDDGTCAVSVQQAREADVQTAFDGMARASASPVLPVSRQPDRVMNSADGPVTVHSYLQGRPSSTDALQLTLSTTASATAHSQAIAMLSVVERAAGPATAPDPVPATGSP